MNQNENTVLSSKLHLNNTEKRRFISSCFMGDIQQDWQLFVRLKLNRLFEHYSFEKKMLGKKRRKKYHQTCRVFTGPTLKSLASGQWSIVKFKPCSNLQKSIVTKNDNHFLHWLGLWFHFLAKIHRRDNDLRAIPSLSLPSPPKKIIIALCSWVIKFKEWVRRMKTRYWLSALPLIVPSPTVLNQSLVIERYSWNCPIVFIQSN